MHRIVISLLIFTALSFSETNNKYSNKPIDLKIKKTAAAMGINEYYEDIPAVNLSLKGLNPVNPATSTYNYKTFTQKPGQIKSTVVSETKKLKKSMNDIDEPQPSFEEQLSLSERIKIILGYIQGIWQIIKSQIEDEVLKKAPSFDEISQNIDNNIKKSSFQPRNYGEKSLLMEEGYLKEFEGITGSKFTNKNEAKFLIDGEQSFPLRYSLIKNARKSIYLAALCFENDITGLKTANFLIKKKTEGVDVRVIIDNKTISRHGSIIVKKLEENNVEVLKYQEDERQGDILHAKMLIVDGEYAIVGGMNIGAMHSHEDPQGEKWRDTDVFFRGPAVKDVTDIFVNLWNNAIKTQSKNSYLNPIEKEDKEIEGDGNAKIAIIFSNPPYQQGSPIINGIIKAIYGATHQINIENAYFVPIPALSKALLDARARGVEVNILTNSRESMDFEARPLVEVSMKTLLPLYKAGVKVYLKKGQTLHSKFMTVDGNFAIIGSYNLHPRSERYDSEIVSAIIDQKSVKELDEAFNHDISIAKEVKSEEELVPDKNWLARVMEEYFFGQLKNPDTPFQQNLLDTNQ